MTPDSPQKSAPGFVKWIWLACLVPGLVGAILVALSRLTEPFAITYDMGIQLNAAENLYQLGELRSDHFASVSTDLAAPASSPLLTWFPPGFSVAVAALRGLGLSLVASLRTLDTGILLGGWTGWLIALATALSSFSAMRPWFLLWVTPTCFLMPLALSPWSGGTDSALWAATPWVILLMVWSGQCGRTWLAALAGLVGAVAISFRYAGLYLPVLAFLHCVRLFFHERRIAVFSLIWFTGALVAGLIPLVTFNSIANRGSPAPPYTWQQITLASVAKRAAEIAPATSTFSAIAGLAPLDAEISKLVPDAPARTWIGLAMFAVLVAAFGTVGWKSKSLRSGATDTQWLLLAAPLVLVLFLIGASVTTSHLAVADGRYYLPTLPAAPIVILSGIILAANQVFRLAALLIGLAWSAWFCADTAWARPWRNGAFPLNCVLSRSPIELYSFREYFSRVGFPKSFPNASKTAAHYNASEVYPWLDEIRSENPDAVIFVQLQPYFQFREGKSALRGIPEQDYWKRATTSRDRQLFFFVLDQGGEIRTSLTRTPVKISDHLIIQKLETRSGWTLFTVKAPAGTQFYSP